MFAKLEEDNGQVGQAMDIYDRATKNVPVNERYEVRLQTSILHDIVV